MAGGRLWRYSRVFRMGRAILRIVYVVLTTCTAFCGVLVYILLWICMPKETKYIE